ncbi:hypothetical protein EVAR_70332_1 [Eumeta japonica]|uniref:Uncharacterized protein n=1 Tax=Eumeta variegata TaxID=151549 RepID=A0A4C2A4Y1_EUMVA|nr:hypothetical protein EVAR_70332_1 [Eumeta japonica]
MLQNFFFLHGKNSETIEMTTSAIAAFETSRTNENLVIGANWIGRNVSEICETQYFRSKKMFDTPYLSIVLTDLHHSNINRLLIFLLFLGIFFADRTYGGRAMLQNFFLCTAKLETIEMTTSAIAAFEKLVVQTKIL